MFDTSRKQTFERIESFIQQTDRCKIPFIVLVGNKVDITNSKIGVDKQDAINLAKKYDMEYFEICSLDSTSIANLYDYLISSIVNSIPNVPTPMNLMGKGIVIGRTLLENPRYKLALCDIATLYE